MKNLQEVVDWAAEQLHAAGAVCGHGTDNVYDEAAWLTCHAVGLSPLDDMPNREVTQAELEAIQAWLQRRIETRLPTAYLTGITWFAGYAFQVNADVLVPRSPLAELIQEGFEPWADVAQMSTVLDLCTGSGCIGIATALHFQHLHVDLADISTAALAVAKGNISTYDLAARVQTIESDFFSALKGKRYDLILTNPPYVPNVEVDELPAEYQAEPRLGLASGDDGLDAACVILNQAAQYLNEGGHLILEVGDSWRRLQEELPQIPLLWLEFYHGGDGVLIIRREELFDQQEALQKWQQQRSQIS